MNSNFDIQSIAQLARIKIDATQERELQGSIEKVLAFIGQIKGVSVPEVEPKDFFYLTKNRLRADTDPDQPGQSTEEILRVAPNRRGNYFQVKKIISK